MMTSTTNIARWLVTVADDFGLSLGVNEAVEAAARSGILTSASLMVSGAAAADAAARARALPNLHVGLHLVVIEGKATLPPDLIPDLVNAEGWFASGQLRLGLAYYVRPRVRRQLAAEIRAQFEAFRATGLVLDHANAHKHMHLHPVVGRLMIDIGREYGLRAIRVPAEPSLRGLGTGGRALRWWCGVLRRQARRGGMLTNDAILGLADTGHLVPARVQALLERLPAGLTELYFHPATYRDSELRRLMPGYEHEAEFAALMECQVPSAVALTNYTQQVPA
jgi:hopanoid biosynthesis associated protein HpnK